MPPIPLSSPPLPRLIVYYQTHHTPSPESKHISVLPLIMQPGIHLTHLILAAIHINEDPNGLTLNDHHPSHPRFDTLWAELRILQASGVKVLGMLGGAAKGSFTRLDLTTQEQFERYYAPLATLVRERGLDGLDLDVEEEMSLGGIIRLIDRLRADFGQKFIITLAPVAAALISPRHNLSGFDYAALERERGREIAWYNAQFYCGWGDCSNPAMYEMILLRGWKKEKIVVGLVTSPENGGGWVPWEVFGSVVPLMRGKGEGFGGVMGWEYFNGLPGGRERPWEWARGMTRLLREVEEEGKQGGDAGGSGGGSASGRTVLVAPVEAPKVHQSKAVDEEEGEDDGDPIPVPRDFEYYSDGNGSGRE
ncbi:chitinase 2 [Cladorrhinum sp. PSN259]|nr:chitinase 2 [Cladorrhinum sp. PSN259]